MGQINILSTDGTHKAGLSFTGTSDISVDTGNIASKTELDSKPTGFKNYIINGGFDVWQRGTSFTTPNSQYTSDMWKFQCDGGTSTVSKDINSGIAITNNTSSTGWVQLYTRLEGKNFRNFIYNKSTVTMTLSFNVWTSHNENCVLYIVAPTSEDNYASTTTVVNQGFTLIAGNNYKTFTFTADVSAIKSGLHVTLVDSIGTAGQTIVWQKVQLEEGSVATPFEQRPYGLELSLCQRYYEAIGHPFFTGRVNGGGTSRLEVVFDVKKRTIPTLSSAGVFSVSDMYTADRLTINNPPITFSHITTRGAYFEIASASINGGAFSNGSVIHSLCDNTTGVVYASAEL